MMNISAANRLFVSEHLMDNTARLMLSAHRYPDVDMPWVVDQIEARRRLRVKLPEWYALPDLVMAGRVPAEQCSSEATARFKASLMGPDCQSLCDMTGGMGVDFWYMSRACRRAVYTERQEALCDVARHNFVVLEAAMPQDAPRPVIEVRHGEALQLPVPDVDVIYVDPARRDGSGGRIYEIADCQPDVVTWQDELLRHCHRLIVKVSPMADITQTLRRLLRVTDVYVLGVHNECKELLIVQSGLRDGAGVVPGSPRCHCVDFLPSGPRSFSFDWEENTPCISQLDAAAPLCYLYEPDVTVMKAMAFGPLARRYGVSPLDIDSHLFVSEAPVADFPGRSFEVIRQEPFSSRQLRQLRAWVPQANVATRNFPLTADQLRQRAAIRDGGDLYLFGSTRRAVGAVLLLCRKWLGVLLLLLTLLPLSLVARPKTSKTPSIEEMLAGVTELPASQWPQGMPFVFLNDSVDVTLHAEQLVCHGVDSGLRGSVWRFQSLVSEEDWMGQQLLQLRFLDAQGRAYRFSTGRSMKEAADYRPHIPALYPLHLIVGVDSLLRSRTLYINYKDDPVVYPADTLSHNHSRYVPVVIDSVAPGSELAPLCVWFHDAEGYVGYAKTCLPDSRQSQTTLPVTRVFSSTNPYLQHPDILPEVWQNICQGRIVAGMTLEEVRLAWGRPLRSEQVPTSQGMIELWYFNNNRVLQFIDGQVYRVGRN